MITICPNCGSENVIRPMADANEFICNDCGEDFRDDDAEDLIGDEEWEEDFDEEEMDKEIEVEVKPKD